MPPNTGLAANQALYQDFVEGTNIEYKFDLAPGNYQVTLKMVNTDYATTGQSSFNVLANGTQVIGSHDSFLGGYFNAFDMTFNTSVSGNTLDLVLSANQGLATLSAIQVLGLQPASTPTFAPTACETANPYGMLTQDMAGPAGVGVDSHGNLFVSQASSSGNEISEFQSNGVPVRSFGVYGNGINNPANAGQILMDNANGLLYVKDTNNLRVSVWTQQGSPVTVIGAGQLSGPQGMALDGHGNFYVADGNRVVEYSLSTYQVEVTIGNGAGTAPGQINGPQGIAFGPDGNLYVAENNNPNGTAANRVSVFTPGGTFVRSWVPNGGQLSAPEQVRFDSHGLLWEFDGGTNKIQVFDVDGDLLGSYACQVNDGSFLGGFDFTANGGFYVSDYSGQRVVDFAPCGTVPTATPTVTLAPTACETANPYGMLTQDMAGPAGVGVDSHGNLFVSQASSSGNEISEFQSKGVPVRSFGVYGNGINNLANAGQILMDNANGLLYVKDTNNLRVSVRTQQGSPVTVIGAGQLSGPQGMALDGHGNFYVADGNRVVEYSLSTYQVEVTIGNGAGTAPGQINGPQGIAFGPDGNLYVAENNNPNGTAANRVSVFTPGGTFGRSWVPNGGQLSAPEQVRFDSHGLLWEFDGGTNKIQVFDVDGDLLGSYACQVNDGSFLGGFDFTANGGFYVSDYSGQRVVDFAPCGTVPTATPTVTLAPTACETANPYGMLTQDMAGPAGVGVDSHGNLFVSQASFSGNQIWEFQPGGGVLRSFAPAGGGYNSVSGPSQILMDNLNGLLYVQDIGNARVGIWSQQGVAVTVIGASQLSGPGGMALDGHGSFYVADGGNNRVLEYSLSTYQTEVTIGNGAGTAPGQINGPEGIAFGPDGNLYVAESSNPNGTAANRVSVFTPGGTFVRSWVPNGGQLSAPEQLRFDSHGLIWEFDLGTDKIQVFDVDGNYLGSYVGQGNGNGQVNDGRYHGSFDFTQSGGFYISDYNKPAGGELRFLRDRKFTDRNSKSNAPTRGIYTPVGQWFQPINRFQRKPMAGGSGL